LSDITMPQLGETVTEGTIVTWLKKIGDPVACDEPLFEVSTDKVDSEVPSPYDGYLAEILVAEGETVEVGARLAVISSLASAQGSESPASGLNEPVVPPTDSAPEVAVAVGSSPPVAQRVPREDRQVMSPLVRRLVVEHAIDPSLVPGTGRGGRITRTDVLDYIDRLAASGADQPSGQAVREPPAPPAPATVVASPLTAASGLSTSGAQERDEIVPFTKIRRLTAEHMVRSKATSAHTFVAFEADYEAIERVRSAHKAQFRQEEGIGLTYLAFVARAVVEALHDYGQLNASVGEDALIVHKDVNLAVAVDLDQRGLVVPVVRNAEASSLRGLARAMANLALRAKTHKLSPDDLTGGTFTITNAGPFGTFLTVPIINQPQVAILSTDGVRRRPVVLSAPDGTEALAIHSVGMLGLSFDHRAVDGAYAAAFMRALVSIVESHDWESEL